MTVLAFVALLVFFAVDLLIAFLDRERTWVGHTVVIAGQRHTIVSVRGTTLTLAESHLPPLRDEDCDDGAGPWGSR